ncbi:uncharacterized protein LOC128199868 [Bicyclus anynana]|uniref:Uncharacterized protein LOC128199868 n=1 Tax=Bicyclus anynana TaxID=110368 RepID=A0ABM3M7Q6_BICAN|nr:uncharacterized protein LOC128199868 [Bicyclus anynana]
MTNPSSSVAATSELAAITLSSKIPDFWTDQPRVWFIRTEAMLAPQKLSDDARYDLVVSKLNKEAIQQVTDLLIEPPPTKKFDTLKARLLKIYEESKNRQLQKLISEMELGEQKPSQLLRRMRELAKDSIPDDTLRILWQGHLPSSVRAVLAVSEIKELEHLSSIADNVYETTRTTHNVSEITQPPTTDTDRILAEIAKLTVKVNELERSRSRSRPRRWNYDRSRSASRTRDPSEPRRTPDSPGWLCFYHNRFRGKARKCTEPCAWKNQSEN